MTKFYGNIFAILTTINQKSEPSFGVARFTSLYCTAQYFTIPYFPSRIEQPFLVAYVLEKTHSSHNVVSCEL